MYCPVCRTEYREGFYECADCHGPLAPGVPPIEPRDIDLELVSVLETGDPFAVTLAKASLEEAGIEYLIADQDIPGFGALVSRHCRILVARDRASEARALLEPLAEPQE